MKCFKNVSTVFALLSCICAGTSFAQPLKYRVIELGALSDSHSVHAYAINKHGQIVGKSGSKAFVWNPNGGMRDLGSLPGAKSSTAFDINSSGQIVGKSGNRAFIFNPRSGMTELPTGLISGLEGFFSPEMTAAYGINDIGNIVGVAQSYGGINAVNNQNSTKGSWGVTWENSGQGVTDIGGGAAHRINSNNNILVTSSVYIHLYKKNSSGNYYERVLELGGFPIAGIDAGGAGSAFGINEEGHFVGAAFSVNALEPNTSKAFYWHPEKGLLELEGSDKSAAFAINNKNHVVGRCGTTINFACMWLNPEEMIELSATLENNDSKKIILHEARGINDSGQIIANGTINGQQRAFLLNPVDSSYESQQKYVRQKR